MSSVQERLQMKREPLDKWSVREQLCLASAVARSGDQNWMSVSRALKQFGEPNRPTDWFHQKNCAAQYGTLLCNVETPKRKKRASSIDAVIETPAEHILKRLLTERQTELNNLLAEEKSEYQKLQEDMILLQNGKVTEEQLDIWCREIDEEENRKEQEALTHAHWLKEREQRKQDIERAWRPNKPLSIAGQKRKNSDSLDSFVDTDHLEDLQQSHIQQPQEPPKPALSPLLTSLLKSPSQVQNTSILHSAITNTRHVPSTSTNPMIASLLNSSTNLQVSPGLQQLVSSAIGQNQDISVIDDQNQPLGNDILDDSNLPNIKLDDLANSILVQDGPLPEIKKEEVDDIISEIIENAQDIVADPEQHLQLDGNGDININLELDDFDDEDIIQESEPSKEKATDSSLVSHSKPIDEKTSTVVDPFEFQEDPIIFESKPSGGRTGVTSKQDSNYVPLYQQQQPQFQQIPADSQGNGNDFVSDFVEEIKQEMMDEKDIKTESIKNDYQEDKKDFIADATLHDTIKTEKPAGSVEIVEVVVMDEDDLDKELNKSQIQDIVHSTKSDDSEDTKLDKNDTEEEKTKTETEESSSTSESKDTATFEESSEASDTTSETKKDVNINLDVHQDSMETNTITPDFSEDLYNEMSMEVKVDKSGGIKRDYSRTKRKEDKDFDMLLAIEKAQLEDSELTEENFSDNTTDTDKKDIKPKIKSENDRSSSPWTEEEDNSRSKRRYSTPATPVDSVPNSPASSNAFYEDDRDYRNWKKSVMLVYNRLATNKYASLFLKPITEEQAPGYSSIVYRPVDLQTIKKNIDNGTIRTTLEFKRDVMLMFTNALMYNKSNGTIYNMAMQMQQESLQPFEILLLATQGDVPSRRETRTSESGVKRKRTLTDELLKGKKKKED